MRKRASLGDMAEMWRTSGASPGGIWGRAGRAHACNAPSWAVGGRSSAGCNGYAYERSLSGTKRVRSLPAVGRGCTVSEVGGCVSV